MPNFEHISHFVLVFLVLTLNMQLPVGMCYDEFWIGVVYAAWIGVVFALLDLTDQQ